MKRVFQYMWKDYKFSFLVVVVCIIVSAIANVQGLTFMQVLIDDYITPMAGNPNPDFAGLASAILKLAAIFAVGILCAYLYNRIMVNIGQGTMRNLRISLFSSMEALPIKYFDTHAHGDIMSVYTNDVDTLRQLISQSIPQTINSAVTIVTVFWGMINMNIPLTVLALVMVGLMLVVTKKLGGKSGFYFKEQQKAIGRVNGYIEEMMEGQKVVKVFCHEEKSLEEFKKINEELRVSADHANKFANILMPVNGNLGNISYVLCAVMGGVLASNGYTGLTLGALISFLTLNRNFTQPITQISQQINSIVMAGAGAARVFALMDEKPETDEGYVELVNAKKAADGTLTETAERTGLWAWKHPHKADNSVTYTELTGDVVFDDVDFGYDDKKIVLHNIKMFAAPGEKIAFVGSTGAGKTTITNLINRFYDIQDGKIRYDGININKIKKADLRRSLGIVLQDTHLFTGTVMDNIRYGKLDATDEECIAAAKLANAHDFITRLPDGYNTMLRANGANLSQGQRQLLSFARTILHKPSVMILDEATANIDTETEVLIQDSLEKMKNIGTMLIVAHRLSTIQHADNIILLSHGEIMEQGTHQELLHLKGRYYQLYTLQFRKQQLQES